MKKILNLFNKRKRRCPVCRKHYFSEIGSYEICPICGWEDDPIQRKDKNFKGGANKLSVKEARKEYEKKY